jgi:hypothetical protein
MELKSTEVSLLLYLLNNWMEDGAYFGRKDQHYSMCDELYEKLLQEME